MSKDLIVKANDLVVAGYELTANEQRLILTAIAKISPTQIDPETGYQIHAQEFSERFNIHPKTAYRELREAASRLYERSIVIKTKEQTLKARWADMVILDNPYFSDVMSDENWKSVVIWFSPQIIPYLFNLTENFTKYKLSDVTEFGGAYSFRFYEFMMQFKSTGYIKISIRELRDRLDLGDKYPATKDLRVWVIETATKEINEKSPYKVEYNLIKTGKKFTHLELKFKEKRTKKPKEKENRDKHTIDLVDGYTDEERAIADRAEQELLVRNPDASATHIINTRNKALRDHRGIQALRDQAKNDKKKKREKETQTSEAKIQIYEQQWINDCLPHAEVFCTVNRDLIRSFINPLMFDSLFSQGNYETIMSMVHDSFCSVDKHDFFVLPN